MTSIVDQIADWVATFTPSSIPSTTLRAAKRSLIDVCSVAVAGGSTEVVKKIIPRAQETYRSGPCFVFGSSPGLCPAGAAFVNAVAAHSYDFDDTSYVGVVHPSAIIFPTAMAVSEAYQLSGERFLTAYIAGIEAQAAFARSVGNRLFDKGWFNTGVLGTLGAAASASHALGLNLDNTREALRIAVAQAIGFRAMLGTDAKPIVAGRASELGLTSAEFAQQGLNGPSDVIEGPRGFAATFNDGQFDPIGAASLGAPFVLDVPGIALKPYPTCTSTHASIQLATELLKESGATAEQVDGVVCEVTPVAEACLPFNNPHSMREMQFSMPFAVACALVYGTVGIQQLGPTTLQDQKVQRLLPKIAMRRSEQFCANPETLRRYPDAATLTLTLHDGRTLSRTIMTAFGTPGSPMSDGAIEQKFAACTDGLPSDEARSWLNRIRNVEQLPSVRTFFPKR